MVKRVIFSVIILFSFFKAFPQAGTGTYQFLDLPYSSRLAALGGSNVSLRDNDINLSLQNPALLTSETSNIISLNMANYLADIKFGSAIYGHNFGGNNYFSIGMQYVNYGQFQYANETNTDPTTTYFTAEDMALNISYARPLNQYFTVGATLKPVYSAYESYTSFGMALDAGASYVSPAGLFSAGLVFRNIGTQFKGYYSDETGQHLEPLPFDIQLGITKKLSHAPLRFSFTLHDLQQWNLSYESTNQPTQSLITTTSGTTSTSTGATINPIDMAFRHTILAVEFVPTNNFYLTVSYNHRRHQEMNIDGFKTMAGFSFGGGIKLYKFHVGFGMSQFQVGNYTYQFSISTSLKEFGL